MKRKTFQRQTLEETETYLRKCIGNPSWGKLERIEELVKRLGIRGTERVLLKHLLLQNLDKSKEFWEIRRRRKLKRLERKIERMKSGRWGKMGKGTRMETVTSNKVSRKRTLASELSSFVSPS